MNRRGAPLLAAVALLLILVGIKSWMGGRGRTADHVSAPHDAPARVDLAPEEKTRIRRFWSTYETARSLQREGKWLLALTAYSEALELEPTHEDALYNAANCQFELSQFEGALSSLESLVAQSPMSHRGYYQIGLVRSCPQATAVFDLAAAEAAFRRAFEINPEETGALLRLGELAVVGGRDDQVLELFALANQTNARAIEAYYLRAYVHWKAGRAPDAIELLEKAVEHSQAPHAGPDVPGEGDTRPGARRPRVLADEKRIMKPFWDGLEARCPTGVWDDALLRQEFRPVDEHVSGVRARF